MNYLETLFSSEFASALITIALRHSLLLLVIAILLIFAHKLSSSLRALYALCAVLGVGLISCLHLFSSPIEWRILPSEAVTNYGASDFGLDSINLLSSEMPLEGLTAENQIPEASAIKADSILWDPVLIVWSLGALAIIAYWLCGQALLLRLLRGAKRLSSDHHVSLLMAAKCRVTDSTPELYMSKDAKLPFTFGIRRPAIVLPSDAVNWEDERLSMVLLHEAAHIQRRDVAAQFFC